jgi:hypothetical protein
LRFIANSIICSIPPEYALHHCTPHTWGIISSEHPYTISVSGFQTSSFLPRSATLLFSPSDFLFITILVKKIFSHSFGTTFSLSVCHYTELQCLCITYSPSSHVPHSMQCSPCSSSEADHSPPTNVEVKNMWIYTSTSPYAFMA